jgi:DNA-directed RNA polymerase subunit beta'
MAVHLPLYEASQLEARTMMRPSFNVLSPSNGEVILKPTQDMVIGCYYLTLMINNKSILKNGSQMKKKLY